MRIATLLHNPVAGDEAHTKDKLIALIESRGYKCHYSSVKEQGLDLIHEDTEFIIIAGGDGTVRKVAKQLLLDKSPASHLPIALLPMGTANNIARTLGISGEPETIIRQWATMQPRTIDIWDVDNLPGARFFCEGLGFGVFPQLIAEMRHHDEELSDSPEKRMEVALGTLHDITVSYKPHHCIVIADGTDYSGDYIMVEIMNMQCIGPNLVLASEANPGDGYMEIVLIAEGEKGELARYISNRISGVESFLKCKTLKARNVKIQWEGHLVHVDDELIEMKEIKEISLSSEGKILHFMVPGT
ncbi:diacylglycerol kinase family enzyme [Arcticibacter tournemirensis]|uniref:Diacylglycerol kinase n=1 Tax=Arcticibacter tournemirensis TaxID=699437 RepID=A0A5M9HDH6_9SPHI|nr:diacylglycerol kinase family protein [Arcticibacter tournemirensis]KAA8483661.1 diacylglycerol kinase [Arcticibacter tournemirensis]TQM51380.1 diacylglycerol kinase family enzyme [Arcticibacter tournemirensis]